MATSGLDDPRYAAFAWRRYKRLMIWMVAASALAATGGLAFLKWQLGTIPFHMMIATTIGIFASVLLAAGLMGLVFLSAGSGHDDAIVDPFSEDDHDS